MAQKRTRPPCPLEIICPRATLLGNAENEGVRCKQWPVSVTSLPEDLQVARGHIGRASPWILRVHSKLQS